MYLEGRIDICIEERRFYVEEVDKEAIFCCIREYKTNERRINNCWEGIFEVDMSQHRLWPPNVL